MIIINSWLLSENGENHGKLSQLVAQICQLMDGSPAPSLDAQPKVAFSSFSSTQPINSINKKTAINPVLTSPPPASNPPSKESKQISPPLQEARGHKISHNFSSSAPHQHPICSAFPAPPACSPHQNAPSGCLVSEIRLDPAPLSCLAWEDLQMQVATSASRELPSSCAQVPTTAPMAQVALCTPQIW